MVSGMLICLCLAAIPVEPAAFLDDHDPVWEVAPTRWLEGIPMGNGDIGALIWGDGNPLHITLDKYDAWDTWEVPLTDETYQGLRDYVRKERAKPDYRPENTCDYLACWRLYADAAGRKPTRLPLPRMELDFGGAFNWQSARLSFMKATISLQGTVDDKLLACQFFVDSNRNVLMIRAAGAAAPQAHVRVRWDHLQEGARNQLRAWGYPDPEVREGPAGGTMLIRTPNGYALAIAWRLRPDSSGDAVEIRLAIQSSEDTPDPLAAAEALCAAFPDSEKGQAAHEAWWETFWTRSYLTIPDARLESLYYFEMYKLGCLSRPGGLPITLQGLWTRDGTMPPWSGDYHLDLNVQMSYWPVYAANRLELGMPLYETFSKCLPRWQKQCREFFGFDGIWSGCAIGPKGERVFGYSTVEYWPGNAAFLAHNYWLHFLYSQDEQFLQRHALPMIEQAFLTYANLLEPDEEGSLHLPMGYSPEYFEGRLEAYDENATVDLALIRFLARAIIDAHERMGSTSHPLARRAREVLEGLVDFRHEPPARGARINERNPHDRLWISENVPQTVSHRHHSHLMAIHPLGLLSIDGDPGEAELIRASLREIVRFGTGQWCGYSFSWMSMIASRARYGNMAWQMLDLYANAFITPNTFHVNGDSRHFGLAMWDYEPMTLEGGFAAAAAIQEMLLQSQGGTIRVFPSMPDRWHEACFADLRTEGAFLITAQYTDGRVSFVRVQSEAGGLCRIANPFGDQPAVLMPLASPTGPTAGPSLQRKGEVLEFRSYPGYTYLLCPEGQEPSSEVICPPPRPRDPLEQHYYGKKRFPRF